ncbi:MAG: hypothetical protein LBH26_02705 [Treponema sp.]|jgi:hypothetical protein|nr:hypothetical protein [Treponema sp.]
MKKGPLILLFLTLLFGASCKDPIFYDISREVKPREPRIKGVPTKFAVYDDFMYVAAASLHRYGLYRGAAGWDHGEWTAPLGRVTDLAATSGYLYALVDYNSPSVWRWKTGMTEWERLGGYDGSPQSIYGETDAEGKPVKDGKVFVGTRTKGPEEEGIDYLIYYADEGASPESVFKPLPLGGNTGHLSGAAFDGAWHFISTRGRGVYAWDGVNAPVQLANRDNPDDKNRNLAGLIRTGTGAAKVFAFGRNTEILELSPTGFTEKKGASSYYLTGALALWRDPVNPGTEGKILLGIKDGSNYAYQEVRFYLSEGDLVLNNSGGIDIFPPGDNPPSSLKPDSAPFDTTIRPHPVNSILQVPPSVDPAMVIFAAVQGTGSTTNDIDSGVWSYRSRDGTWQWNAEE